MACMDTGALMSDTDLNADAWRRIARKWERRALAKQAQVTRLTTSIAAIVTQLDNLADDLDALNTGKENHNAQAT